MKTIITPGQRYGRLVVVKEVEQYIPPSGNPARQVLCKCDCGKETIIRLIRLTNGTTTSCGCLQSESVKTLSKKYEERTGLKLPKDFAFSSTRIYKIWRHMCGRCKNKNERYYYGKGISVCDEWKNDFISFYLWAMDNGYSDELTIDRINSNGNYEPSNCRWATYKQQNNNNCLNRIVTFKGETHTIGEWGDITGIGRDLLYERIVTRKVPIEKALTEPKETHRANLTQAEVVEIRQKYNSGTTCQELSKEYKIDESSIQRVVKYKTYKNVK